MIACICGGVIEVALTAGGVAFFTSLYRLFKKLCYKFGCKCKCHTENLKKQDR